MSTEKPNLMHGRNGPPPSGPKPKPSAAPPPKKYPVQRVVIEQASESVDAKLSAFTRIHRLIDPTGEMSVEEVVGEVERVWARMPHCDDGPIILPGDKVRIRGAEMTVSAVDHRRGITEAIIEGTPLSMLQHDLGTEGKAYGKACSAAAAATREG